MGRALRPPWEPAGEWADGLVLELESEIAPSHVLYGKKLVAVARRRDNDDVLFETQDEPAGYAFVHLTWRGGQEPDPTWPYTVLFSSWEDWQQWWMTQQDA
jgi:hypothetical protein